MNPAERLRAAADLIERTGAAATPGPWERDGGSVRGSDTDPVRVQLAYGPPVPAVIVQSPAPAHRTYGEKADNAAWIALLGPDTAPTLAAWLRSEAACQELGIANFNALAFADLILRGDA